MGTRELSPIGRSAAITYPSPMSFLELNRFVSCKSALRSLGSRNSASSSKSEEHRKCLSSLHTRIQQPDKETDHPTLLLHARPIQGASCQYLSPGAEINTERVQSYFHTSAWSGCLKNYSKNNTPHTLSTPLTKDGACIFSSMRCISEYATWSFSRGRSPWRGLL